MPRPVHVVTPQKVHN